MELYIVMLFAVLVTGISLASAKRRKPDDFDLDDAYLNHAFPYPHRRKYSHAEFIDMTFDEREHLIEEYRMLIEEGLLQVIEEEDNVLYDFQHMDQNYQEMLDRVKETAADSEDYKEDKDIKTEQATFLEFMSSVLDKFEKDGLLDERHGIRAEL